MRKNKLVAQFHLLGAIRDFFNQQGFMDVMTPPMVLNPGMETHIHPFQVTHTITNKPSPWYLHTSPEFHMKELMSLGFGDIFTLVHSFRDEPEATHHRPQFIMLEWYRRNAHYTKIMQDTQDLFAHSLQYLENKNVPTQKSFKNVSFQKATIQEIFQETIGVDILNFLDKKDLKELIQKDFKDVPLPVMGEELSWDDYYFLLFLNKIENTLVNYPYLLLYEFPYHLSALSTLKATDNRVCERFEVYSNGVELCNCFNELTDLSIQKNRFEFQAKEKQSLYGYSLPEAQVLYDSLERGLPQSAGIALGVERFLKTLTGIENPFWN